MKKSTFLKAYGPFFKSKEQFEGETKPNQKEIEKKVKQKLTN